MVIIPEVETNPELIADILRESYEKGKSHAIVIVAEGAKYNALALDEFFSQHRERLGFELRVTILGHVQRGGYPSAYDRILASRLGAAAVEELSKGNYGVLVGMRKGQIVSTPLEEAVNKKKDLDPEMIRLAKILD
jgi:6-phosphofructokinase 1